MWQRLAIRHGREFVRHVAPAIMRPARALWNEVIGFVFLCFAVAFGFRTGHYAWNYFEAPATVADPSGFLGRMIMAAFCTALTAYFAFTSFLRARRISRS